MPPPYHPNPTGEEPTGNCYQWAGDTILSPTGKWSSVIPEGAERLRLVHGYPVLSRPPHCRYGHAWLEFILGGAELVIDGHLGCLVYKSAFYLAGQIEPEKCRRYSKVQARYEILKHEHWGPWE